MKILLVANTDWYLYNFRLDLAQALRQRGDEVVLASPRGQYASKLVEAGFRWINLPMEQHGLNPLTEVLTIWRFFRLYQKVKPDLVHHFTVKCVLYGSIAGHLTGIRGMVNSVEGLGYIFTKGSNASNWLRNSIKILYRPALKGTWVIFHNPDDQGFFVDNRLADPQRMTIIRSSGVDITKFAVQPFAEGVPVVILPARMLWEKGIKEFVEAAKLIKKEKIQARFALVGATDENNPASVHELQLKAWENEGAVEWWGWKDAMQEIYAQAAIVCLPSFYREGVPKALIEAAACGRPIITTDVAGCRETVNQGENGLLVSERNIPELTKALKELLKHPELRKQMGICSRKMAEEEFSHDLVNSQILAIYKRIQKKQK